MAKDMIIGKMFTWTPQDPSKTEFSSEKFDAFIDDYFSILDDAHISGEVIYNDGKSAIIEVTDMTQSLFPFTLFYNEVKNNFPHLDKQNSNPYQKYFCVDIASMTSLYLYDMDYGCLTDAVYDDEGNFDYYDLPTDDGFEDLSHLPELPEATPPEQITIRLDESEIEELENQDALLDIENWNILVEDENGNLSINNKGVACSIERARTWFNTRDCAILSAWRQGKLRKENDDNNRMLQQRLRELGYGVTKVTGWYPEENREMARENSFLTVNLNDEESFRDNLSELSELYDQECFLYKKSGYDNPAVYVYTKDVDEYQKGDVKLLGRLRIGNMDADAYSQIRAGRITFE